MNPNSEDFYLNFRAKLDELNKYVYIKNEANDQAQSTLLKKNEELQKEAEILCKENASLRKKIKETEKYEQQMNFFKEQLKSSEKHIEELKERIREGRAENLQKEKYILQKDEEISRLRKAKLSLESRLVKLENREKEDKGSKVQENIEKIENSFKNKKTEEKMDQTNDKLAKMTENIEQETSLTQKDFENNPKNQIDLSITEDSFDITLDFDETIEQTDEFSIETQKPGEDETGENDQTPGSEDLPNTSNRSRSQTYSTHENSSSRKNSPSPKKILPSKQHDSPNNKIRSEVSIPLPRTESSSRLMERRKRLNLDRHREKRRQSRLLHRVANAKISPKRYTERRDYQSENFSRKEIDEAIKRADSRQFCQFYKNGKCMFGTRCTHFHDEYELTIGFKHFIYDLKEKRPPSPKLVEIATSSETGDIEVYTQKEMEHAYKKAISSRKSTICEDFKTYGQCKFVNECEKIHTEHDLTVGLKRQILINRAEIEMQKMKIKLYLNKT